MKSFKPFLILLLAVVFISSTAVWAKRITGKANFTFERVSAAGNLLGPTITVTGKGIKFSRSGVIINRAKARVLNESGSRQRFLFTRSFLIFDPQVGNFTMPTTRAVVKVGKPNKRNLARSRFLGIFNPKKAP